MTGLALPLSAEDNKPIWDAAGQLVSIPEHAGAFAHAMNMHAKMTDALRGTIYHLMVLVAMCPDTSHAKSNAQRILAQVGKLVAESEKGAKLPPVEEVGEQAIADVLDDPVMAAFQALDAAKTIKAKFRVYAR